MKNHKILILFAVFMFSISVSCTLNAQTEYKFPKGSSLQYKSNTENKEIVAMMGQEEVITTATSENVLIAGLGLVNNNFKVEFCLNNIKITSDNPHIDMSTVDFSFMNNKKSSALVSKQGLVSSIEAIDIIESPADPTAYSIMQQYNPALFFSKFFLVLPKKELKVGEIWKDNKTDMIIDGDVAINTEYLYTVSEIVNYNGYSCFKIICSLKMSYHGQSTQGGQEFKVSGKGEGEGVFFFARKEGILVSCETNHSSNINMDFTAMGMTIPTTNIVSTKIELVK